MKVGKTIKAKVLELRKRKEELLRREYENWQRYLHGDKNVQLYSATRQCAERLLRRLKGKVKDREYPMDLRRDVIKLVKRDTKLTSYWFRVPVFGKRGGIWIPIRPHEDIDLNWSIREAKLIRKNGDWFVYIYVEKEVEEPKLDPNNIIAIDVGDKVIATKVELRNGKVQNPKFYGREVRGIRRHYDWLRRRLGERKLLKVIKRIGNKESRKVDDILHKISREIVNRAKEIGATIVIGYPKGIRRKRRGKVLNRIVNRMPYYMLIKYIEYKAKWEGVAVLLVNEYDTSRTCHRCGEIGKRVTQGLFKCEKCGLEYNADLNAAINIGKLALGYMLRAGVGSAQPLTGHEDVGVECLRKASTSESPESPNNKGECRRENAEAEVINTIENMYELKGDEKGGDSYGVF